MGERRRDGENRKLAAVRELGLEPVQNAEQNEALSLSEAAFRQAGGQLSAISRQLLDFIRSASSFDNLASEISSFILHPSSLLEGPIAIAIFNVHLLGRSQIYADAVRDRGPRTADRRPRTDLSPLASRLSPLASRLAAVVLEPEFEPLPFDEAIDFFRSKLNLSPAQFERLSEAARAKAFTIAGGATRQARRSVMDLIQEALTEGVTLREFQARANDVLDAAGLSQRTPWYWETVYRTNLATSYQAGRWKQMTDPEVAAARPFLRYVSARLPTSRPSHVEKHGVVKPVDDPFWDEWMPPNGFNCYCTVQSVSESLLQRRGWQVSQRSQWLPADQGFQFNPGKAEAI